MNNFFEIQIIYFKLFVLFSLFLTHTHTFTIYIIIHILNRCVLISHLGPLHCPAAVAVLQNLSFLRPRFYIH